MSAAECLSSEIDLVRDGLVPTHGPGWGNVIQFSGFPEIVKALANTGAFKRLVGISHAGFGRSVANISDTTPYSRAVHSLTAVGVSQYILERRNIHPNVVKLSMQEMLIGALFHDIGHYSTSHSAENAFSSLDHKAHGIKILRNDPEIQAIFQAYGIDTDRVITAGMEKWQGNPFALRREEGDLSLDHLANIITDLYKREGIQVHPKVLERLMNTLYLNEQAKLALPESEVGLMRMMVELVIAQNHAIFSHRSMLNDGLGEAAMLELVATGRLSADDLQGVDSRLQAIMADPEAPEFVQYAHYAIEHAIPATRDDVLKTLIHKVDEGPLVKSKLRRDVDDLYLLVPMIGERSATSQEEVARRFEDTRGQLLGTFEIDMDGVLGLIHKHQVATGQKERQVRVFTK